MRYWQVERLVGDTWLTTDWYESGKDEAAALGWARQAVIRHGWDGVRLGKELTNGEQGRYCSLVWLNLD